MKLTIIQRTNFLLQWQTVGLLSFVFFIHLGHQMAIDKNRIQTLIDNNFDLHCNSSVGTNLDLIVPTWYYQVQ